MNSIMQNITTIEMYKTSPQRRTLEELVLYRSVLFLFPLFIQHCFFYKIKRSKILHSQWQGSPPKVRYCVEENYRMFMDSLTVVSILPSD